MSLTDDCTARDTIRPTDEDKRLLTSLTITEDSLSSIGSRQTPLASSILSSSYHGSETDDSLSISVDQDRTPFEQRLHGIEQTIDRLYRLSVAIRRPSIVSQNAKAANFPIRDEDGNDVGEQFADFALTWITHQFPEAPPVLRERLAKSVTLRRKRFLFRQSHQKKLGLKSFLTTPPRPERSPSPGLDADSTVMARTVVQTPVPGLIKNSTTFSSPGCYHKPLLRECRGNSGQKISSNRHHLERPRCSLAPLPNKVLSRFLIRPNPPPVVKNLNVLIAV